MPHLAPYSTSKFAFVGLSEAMRAELVKDGIYVVGADPPGRRRRAPQQRDLIGHGRQPA